MSEERLGQVQIHCPELKDLFHASQNFEELKPPPPHPHIERVTYSSCCNFVDQGCAFSLSFCRENVLESTTDKACLISCIINCTNCQTCVTRYQGDKLTANRVLVSHKVILPRSPLRASRGQRWINHFLHLRSSQRALQIGIKK